MSLRLIQSCVCRRDIATRMPFRYGIATMTDVPHVIVTVTVELNGTPSRGQSADHLPPKWFTKEPDAPVQEEIADMEDSIGVALREAAGTSASSAYDFWLQLYQRLMAPPTYPPLLQHFGISLVERAVLDAVCRHQRQPLWRLIRDGRLGIDLGKLSPELRAASPADFLPQRPLDTVDLRHTVGMADYLRDRDIPASQRLYDGLPQSLESCITAHGLRQFKLKLCGIADRDLERLSDIAAVVCASAPADFRFSLDGNEQFDCPQQLHAFGERVYSDERLARFFEHLLFIEQPIGRKVALAESAPDVSTAWPRKVPIIIDESDGALEDFPRALEFGYSGVSHKNCKGVFKGIRNRCLIGLYQRRYPDRTFLMTGEDLANVGPVALLQDLAVQALLGNASVERNGHHYFRGLSMFPRDFSSRILADHQDLYQAGRDGVAFLRVDNGQLQLASVNSGPAPAALFVDCMHQ